MFVANTLWIDLYKYRVMELLISRKLDYKTILLVINEESQFRRDTKNIFRFKAKWVLEFEERLVFEEAWEKSTIDLNPVKEVQLKLMRCKGI